MKRIKSYKLFKESQEINGSEIYTIEEGCGKVYHGGKLPPNDLDLLFREQGGMYGCKMIPAAYNWQTILGQKTGSTLLTKRVYELSVKPGTKMIDESAAGQDSGRIGGLKNIKSKYTGQGIEGIAREWYMNIPNGEVPKEIPETGLNITSKSYTNNCLHSEIIIFDKSSLVGDIRMVPFREVLESYEKLGLLDDTNYKNLKDNYTVIRNMIWTLELAKPGHFSNIQEFTTISDPMSVIRDVLKEALNKFKAGPTTSKIKLQVAPSDKLEIDELVEKLSKISLTTNKFDTLLDFTIEWMRKWSIN